VSDTTGDDSSNAAGNKIKMLLLNATFVLINQLLQKLYFAQLFLVIKQAKRKKY